MLTTVCHAHPGIKGFDIYHGDSLEDFQAMKAQGFVYGFHKASQGTGMQDNRIHDRWSKLCAAMPVQGAYHWLTPGVSPQAQAENFYKVVKPLLSNKMLLMLDYEEKPRPGLEMQSMQDALLFMKTVKQLTGKGMICYTGPDVIQYLTVHQPMPEEFANYPLMIAEYGVHCPKVGGAWKDWTFWQYSGTGNFDSSVYSGSISDLQHLAATL